MGGCHPNDQFFDQGLSEVKTWLLENPDEVIIIYIEDYIDGQYDKAIDVINENIGSLVCKSESCKPLPMDLSKAKVREAGKQVLLVGAGDVMS